MATVVVCDRCHGVRDVSAFGPVELCVWCHDAFRAWVAAGAPPPKPERRRSYKQRNGKVRSHILELLAAEGEATPMTLAQAAKIPVPTAYGALRHWKTHGLLAQPQRFLKRYVLAPDAPHEPEPELEQKAAE